MQFFKHVMFFLKLRFLLLYFIILFTVGVFASPADTMLNGLRIEGKINYGFIYPHSGFIEYILDGNIHGAEISLSTASTGRHIWEELYRHPRYGLAYNYMNYSNEAILGDAHALFGYCEIPFFQSRNRFLASYQIGFGAAYNTKVYDIYKNPLNHSISTRVNAFISFDVYALYQISPKNHMKLGFELSHYSNGKMRSPNLGINTVTVTAAWQYSIIPERNISNKNINNKGIQRHIVDVLWNFGAKRDDMLDEKLYSVSSIFGEYYYMFSHKYGAGGGIDFFYDESLKPTHEFEEKVEGSNSDNYQCGAHLGLTIRFGNFGIILGAGNYIRAPFHKYTSVYSRFGMRYAVKGKLILNCTVKAHYAIADYVEWGIGYRFNFNKK